METIKVSNITLSGVATGERDVLICNFYAQTADASVGHGIHSDRRLKQPVLTIYDWFGANYVKCLFSLVCKENR